MLEIHTILWVLLGIPLVQRFLGLLFTIAGRDIFELRRVLITDDIRLFCKDFLCRLLGFFKSIVTFRVFITLIRVLNVNLSALGDVLSLNLVLDLGFLLLH